MQTLDYEAEYAPVRQILFRDIANAIENIKSHHATGAVTELGRMSAVSTQSSTVASAPSLSSPSSSSSSASASSSIGHKDVTIVSGQAIVNLYNIIFKIATRPVRNCEIHGYDGTHWVYERYCQDTKRYMQQVAYVNLANAKSQGMQELLKEWVFRWNALKLMMRSLVAVFQYLDRFYINGLNVRSKKLTVRQQAVRLYYDYVFIPFGMDVSNGVLQLIEKYRAGEEIDVVQLRQVINVFIEIGMHRKPDERVNSVEYALAPYNQFIAERVYQASRKHYSALSVQWMEQLSLPDYLNRVVSVLDTEKRQASEYLHQSSIASLIATINSALIGDNAAELLSRPASLRQLVLEKNYDPLRRMYHLFRDAIPSNPSATPCITHFIDAFRSALVKQGRAILAEESKTPAKCIMAVLAHHSNATTIVQQCFGNDPALSLAVRQAFEQFINETDSLSAPLASYTNQMLQRGGAIQPTPEAINNVIALYGYFRDKDVFEHDYKKHLAERLLKGTSSSEADEKELITRFKTQSGYQWGSNLETMFNDITTSKMYTRDYYNAHKDDTPFEFEAHVCSASSWPIPPPPPCRIPPALESVINNFRRIYTHKNAGKELKWRLDLGQADVAVKFSPETTKRLLVTTPMMLILLCFNQGQRIITLDMILRETGMPLDVIADHLLSLCHPSIQVLLKNPNNTSLEPSHKFMINAKFQAKTARVQIPPLKLWAPAAAQEADESKKAIQLGREIMASAAIVRILKARKTLKHTQLVQLVQEQLMPRFQPEPDFIRKRIELLILDGYLERDEEDRSLYKYVA